MLAAYAILVLCNVIPEVPSNIAQEKIQAILAMPFEQHLVTLFTNLYIRSFTSKKYKVMLSLLWKSAETNAGIAARVFYPAAGQTFSRTQSQKLKSSASHAMLLKAMQSCPAVSVKCRDQDCISR